MALYGAFSSSILGMMSQSYAMANISNNIANMNTGGYRATETRFSTLVSTPLFEQSDLGGVKPSDLHLMDVQGNMQSSSRNLDIAVNGTGFFIVSPTMDATTQYYTRDGSLEVQAGETVPMIDESGNPVLDPAGAPMTTREGYLADKNGYFLLGWPVGPDGTVTATGTPMPMRVDQYAFADAGRATSDASLLLNIPSTAAVGESFDYDMSVYDSAGQQHTVVATFTKTAQPNVWDVAVDTGNPADTVELGPTRDFAFNTGTQMAFTNANTITIQDQAPPNAPIDLSALQVGDAITISGTSFNNGVYTITGVSGGTLTVAEPTTLETDVDGASIGCGAKLFSHTTGTQTEFDAVAGTITIADNGGTPLANAFAGLQAGDTITLTGTTANDGTYTITGVSADGSRITVDTATTPLTAQAPDTDGVLFDAPGGLVQRLQFSSSGHVISPQDFTLDVAWGGGATAPTTAMTLDVSRMTQFAGDYLVNTYWQNGYGPSYLNGVTFDSNGYVLGTFDDASDRPLYRVALASFANANGLESHNGNLYSVTEASGEPRVFAPGEQEWAILAPNSRELANVDVADEFSKMIMTQHAYTAASKAFITVDEMTETARDLKR